MVDAGVDELLAETSSLQAGLIILGAHPHSTLYHLIIGSLADDVLKHAHCPVLVVPEPAQTP
jgi:nucleotide-binding universal stress UspA family protein